MSTNMFPSARASLSPIFISYSANREDVFLNRLFAAQTSGWYVDIGAAHPVFENDTKALYDRGWQGINVEPNVEFFRLLEAGRPRDHNLNLAISDVPGVITYYEVVGTGLSTCDMEEAHNAARKGFEVVAHQVECDTLLDVLERFRPPNIDLLKIDVEGFELKVLESNTWTHYRPKLILAEATYPESPVRRPDKLSPFLAGHRYRRVFFDGLNDYFAAEEFDFPENVFDRPPNVFDRFVPFKQHILKEELGISCARLEMLDREVARARIELVAMRDRGTALADQLEAISIKYDQERQQSQIPEYSLYRGSETARQLRRLLRAARRPRRTLRILLGRSPDG